MSLHGEKIKNSKFSRGTNKPVVRDSNWSSVSALTGFIILSLCFFNMGTVSAAGGSITVTISDATVDLNVSPSNNGTFAKSNATTIGVATTNYTGYTLSLTAQTGSNPTALINDTDNTKTLPSITSSITEEQFKALNGTAYNNMWGYLPSKYCVSSSSNNNNGNNNLNCSTNTNFLPSPTTTGDTLDITSVANSTINEYEIAVGARVDTTASLGAYSNVFLVEAVANMIPYSIKYYDNVVGAMPTDITGETEGSTVQISANTPTRTGYSFIGWCSVVPTLNANGTDTCSGTQVAAGGNLSIDQTGDNNNFNLYAMWGGNYTIDGLTYMQDFNTLGVDAKDKVKASMIMGEQYQLRDVRDNNTYYIAKQADGKIWMTQNLDLCIGCTGTAALNSNNTDLNTYGSGAYSEGYTMSNGVITWTPESTAVTSGHTIAADGSVSNWVSDPTEPYSVEGGTTYYYTSGTTNNDIAYSNLQSCIAADHTEEGCRHYHVGNYYNFSAVVASNDSTNIATQYITAENSVCPAGWKLPTSQAGPSSNAKTSEFGQLLLKSSVISAINSTSYATNGFNKIRTSPLFFVRSGNIWGGAVKNKQNANYKSSNLYSAEATYSLGFSSTYLDTTAHNDGKPDRFVAASVRCLLK